MDKINHWSLNNRGVNYDSEEISVLGLVGKLTNKTNEIIDEIGTYDKKIRDLNVGPGMTTEDRASLNLINSVDISQEDITESLNLCLSKGDTSVGEGTFLVSETIVIPQGRKLKLNKNTIIKPTGNFNVFELLPNTSIEGGKIDISLSSHTKACIYVSGRHKNILEKGLTTISNMELVGNNRNLGIHLLASDKIVHSVENECIGWINCTSVNLHFFQTGLLLKAESTTEGNRPWVNGNIFDKIGFEMCLNDIVCNGGTNAEVSGNKFTNIMVQSYSEENIIKCTNAKYNTFDMMIWDFELYLPNKVLFKFDSTSNSNFINSNNIPIKYIEDLGFQNIFKNSEYVKRQKFITSNNNGVDFIQQSNGTTYQFWAERNGVYEGVWDINEKISFTKKISNLPVDGVLKNANGYNTGTNGFVTVYGYKDIVVANGAVKNEYTTLPQTIISTNIVSMSANAMFNVTKSSHEGCQALVCNCVKANDTSIYLCVADIASKLATYGGDGSTFRICYSVTYFK